MIILHGWERTTLGRWYKSALLLAVAAAAALAQAPSHTALTKLKLGVTAFDQKRFPAAPSQRRPLMLLTKLTTNATNSE